MKGYLVWHPILTEVMEQQYKRNPYNVLASYYFLKNTKRKPSFPFILDSGAFSASTTGKPIDIKEYIKFIKQNKIQTYFNLDEISSSEKTLINQKIMEEAGLNPIPVFHIGEDFKYLKEYCKYPYISLGGMVPFSNQKAKLIKWLTKCFLIIPPEVKVHAFGVSNDFIVKSFPFYSFDSSSWVSGGRFGTVYSYSQNKMKTNKIKIKNNTETNQKLNAWNLSQWVCYLNHLEDYHGLQD